MPQLASLNAQQVPVFETFVVPRYLSMFGALALKMLLPCDGAVVASLGCRTGYPDSALPQYLPNCHLFGFDPSEEALALARTKGALMNSASVVYQSVEQMPFPVPDDSFSHAIVVYPLIDPSCQTELVAEAARLLAFGGQVLYALPLRGSYQEIVDLLREYALKHDSRDVAQAMEAHIASRPTIETFSEVFEQCGLVDVDVDMQMVSLPFGSGRDFFEDPFTRMLMVPDLELSLGIGEMSTPLAYVRDAIDCYWSETTFELSVNIGCASARKY